MLFHFLLTSIIIDVKSVKVMMDSFFMLSSFRLSTSKIIYLSLVYDNMIKMCLRIYLCFSILKFTELHEYMNLCLFINLRNI
jgi:hypothetical protein